MALLFVLPDMNKWSAAGGTLTASGASRFALLMLRSSTHILVPDISGTAQPLTTTYWPCNMPRKKVKLNADGYEADPNDPDWDNLSEVSESSSFMTREEGEQLHAENPELTTIEEVQAKWEEIRSYYSRSTCRAAVRQLLEAHRPSEGWKIDAAVIFGSGTPSTRWKGYRDTTMLQLAVFLDIVQYCELAFVLPKYVCLMLIAVLCSG